MKFYLDSKIKIPFDQISKQELQTLKKKFKKSNPSFYRLQAMGKNAYYSGEKPVIKLFDEDENFLLLPRGNFDTIKKNIVFDSIEVIDQRTEKPLNKKPEFKSGFSFWLQQQQAIDSIQEAEFNSGLILGECGSGKTEILLGIFAKLEQKTLVIVDKLALMHQWVKRVKERFKNVSVGIIQGSKFEIENDIVIGSQKTIYNKINKLKNKFGCVLADECITGDAIVTTEKGKMTLEEAVESKCIKVLTYKDDCAKLSLVNGWQYKGNQPILKLKTESGRKIKCTSDHLIMTQEGWKEAGKIQKQEMVLCVNVDVVNSFLSIQNGNINQNINLGINAKKELIGIKDCKKLLKMHQDVNVDVENKLNLLKKQFRQLCNQEQSDIISLFKDIIESFSFNQDQQKFHLLLEQFLVMVVYIFHIKNQRMQDLFAIMESNKKNGQDINLKSFQDIKQNILKVKMVDMENFMQASELHAMNYLLNYIIKCINQEKEFQKKYYLNLMLKVCLGGFVIIGQFQIIVLKFMLKVMIQKVNKLQLSGSEKNLEKQNFIKQKIKELLEFHLKLQEELEEKSNNSLYLPCNTNWEQIIEIEDAGIEKVYDISVPETECFFANEILVHNCHAYAARTFREIIENIDAKHRYGATATLVRKDRKEFLVRAAFGKVLHEITDDELVEEGRVEEVEMIVVPTDFESENYIKFVEQLDGTKKVIDWDHHALLKEMKYNEKRNNIIMEILKKEIEEGHKCLLMFDRVSHCIYWQNLLKQEGIITGLMIGEKGFEEERESAPKDLKEGKINVIIMNNSIQQGMDIPMLDRGFGIHPSGGNLGKLQQQRGRLKRTACGKSDAKFYYFWDKKVHGFEEHLKAIQKRFRKVKVYVKRKS